MRSKTKTALPLSTRTLLLSFLCVCAVLLAGFTVLHFAIKARIREALKVNMQRTQEQVDEIESDYNRRNAQLVSILSEDAGLKAAVGLLREGGANTDVRRTIADQLRAMSEGLDYDLLMLVDTEGKVAATAGTSIDDSSIDVDALVAGHPALVQVGQQLYELTAVPVNLGSDNLGTLAVGKRFNLSAAGRSGPTFLLAHNAIAVSTFPESWKMPVQRQLSQTCGSQLDGCEIRLDSETYLVLEIKRLGLGTDYKLLYLAPLNEAMSGFTSGLRSTFIVTGIGAVLVALLLSVFASRAIAKPLADLAAHLDKSGDTGSLWDEFRLNSSTREVNLLAGALNHAARTRREFEADLKKAKDDAEAGSRAKSEFLANISHELRTPMNGVLGMTEVVLDKDLTPDVRADMALVKLSGEALLGIIDNVLDFSKMETGELVLENVEFDLPKTVRETIKPLRQRAFDEKSLVLTSEIAASVPKVVNGDPVRVRQTLGHLIDNAIKFTHKGEIVVRVRPEATEAGDSVLHFTVQDTGIGIPPEKLDVIFEAFAQADGSATRLYGGTGLGLTISSRLVSMMHGRIWIETDLGRGTCVHFTVRLPAARTAIPGSARAERASTV